MEKGKKRRERRALEMEMVKGKGFLGFAIENRR